MTLSFHADKCPDIIKEREVNKTEILSHRARIEQKRSTELVFVQ